MLHTGIVDEVLQIFILDANYTKEIRRSIGVSEMDKYLREETNIEQDDSSIINCEYKIQLLINEKMWLMHHIIATDVFEGDRKEVVDEAWRITVIQRCMDIVKRFLKNDDHNIIIE
ncbi:hypothetical protein H5410_020893 [Solanum commersonii]|uniref:Uncharacterized protein n=1 Tax=Solanum commersonii TaxID=4109 RepID=A0A9J5ZDK8_SOLCO|nr:hypothetical protein H5410_020893 [Solanum commersonii]